MLLKINLNGGTLLVKKVQKTELFFFLLTIIIFWPNYFINNTIANKRISTISLSSFFLVLLIILLLRYKTKNHILNANWFLTFLSVYILINIYINQTYLVGDVSIRDFAEIGRILGVLLFFYVGNVLSENINLDHLWRFICNISYVYAFLLAGIILNIFVIKKILSLFYQQEFVRFSGTWSAVNYVWIVPLLVFVCWLVLFNRSKITLKYCINSLVIYFATFITLLFSGSRTSIVVFVVSFIMSLLIRKYYYLYHGINKDSSINSIKKILFIFALIFFVLFLFGNLDLLNINEFLVNKLGELKYLLIGKPENIRNLNARISLWKEVYFNEVLMRPIIGHGSAKSMITILDSSYMMTLYRYGLLGLSLEILLYISLMIKYIKYMLHNEDGEVYLIPIVLLLAYLISCFTGSSFYELKLPYFLFLILGFFNNKIGVIRK